ncbi:MAG: hypothetical protein K8S16_09765 [Bacteroidales bacterium]|nr:hypothetical protein [Bacteroidales bacterium]
MSGNSLFVDTNIILYLLSGNSTIADILHKKQIFISFITQLELLGYSADSDFKKVEEINLLFYQSQPD